MQQNKHTKKKKLLHQGIGFVVMVLVIICDQWIKTLIRSLPIESKLWCIPGLLEITHVVNTGVAFSMMNNHPVVVLLISGCILAVFAFVSFRFLRLTPISSLLIYSLFGGGISNLIDRVLHGGVTDYIKILFIRFPIFNLADVCITGSAFLLSILLFTERLEIQSKENCDGSNC